MSQLTDAVIALFAVFGEVEASGFDFWSRPQSDDSFDDVSDDGSADDRQNQCHADGFDLLEDERLELGVCDVAFEIIGGQAAISAGSGQHSGHECAERATHGMNAEGVKGVVITEPGFNLQAEEPRDETGSDSNGHCTLGTDETAGWRDDDEAGNCAGAKTEDAR